MLSRNILLFPRGNNQHDQLSAYLEFADLRDEAKDANEIYACAQFIIVASPPSDPTLTVSQSMQIFFLFLFDPERGNKKNESYMA